MTEAKEIKKREEGRRREKESSPCVSRGNYRCRFVLPLATWLNSFPSSLCPSLVSLGRYRQSCVCVHACGCVSVCSDPCLSVEGGKSENLHNKLKKEGRGRRINRREKWSLLKGDSIFDIRPRVIEKMYVETNWSF